MIGVNLSRWTLSYFAAALFALVVAQGLMVAGYGFPTADLRAPETLVLVHLVTIGWLSLLLCGALFQFVPVLVAHGLYSDTLPLPALVFLVAGLLFLLAGFLQLADVFSGGPTLFFLAAILLTGGFLIVIYNLGRTLWAARPLSLPARFVAIALGALGMTVFLGVIYTLTLGAALNSGALTALTGPTLPLHVIGGLCGWLSFAAIGVSYRLLAMFMLAPELDGWRPHTGFWLGTAALSIALLGGPACLYLRGSITPALVLSGILGLAALGLYGADSVHLYRARKRRIIELNSQMAALALASLGAVVLLGLVFLGFGLFEEQIGAIVFLAAFGWLTGLGLAKLYKIVAFLTWLECYGPVLGKTVTPRVQDLVVESRARRWFILYYLSVWAATAALLISSPIVFRFSAAIMLLATLAIILELVRARRLADVVENLRFPAGVVRPYLLLSSAETK
ncbi:hypothetical protein ACFPLB_02380 [Aquamicrobium segne]|uniref:Uncharacterized protein n=1 Tax=Aquamicrobium segne TaxID=469547 RepID=A0ABW0GU66_9HYPH